MIVNVVTHNITLAVSSRLDVNLHVKVADFGLCRDIYSEGYYTSDNNKKLPIRWMAPESIGIGKYSSSSDVVSGETYVRVRLTWHVDYI